MQILAYIVGIIPFNINYKEETIQFRLFSFSTLLSFVRLVVFNLPFTILPCILWPIIASTAKENFMSGGNETTADNETIQENINNNISVLWIIAALDYFSNYLYFPFCYCEHCVQAK